MHQITKPSCIYALNQVGRQKGASKTRTIMVVVVVEIHWSAIDLMWVKRKWTKCWYKMMIEWYLHIWLYVSSRYTLSKCSCVGFILSLIKIAGTSIDRLVCFSSIHLNTTISVVCCAFIHVKHWALLLNVRPGRYSLRQKFLNYPTNKKKTS